MSADRLLVRHPRDVITSTGKRAVVAGDGGMLVKRSDILISGSILGGFLADRTMSTGLHIARRKDQPRGTSPLTISTPGSWRTSIGHSYYKPNSLNGTDIRSTQQRQDVLARNVSDDIALVSQWDTVDESLHAMKPSVRARVQRAVLHILANDAAAVDYAFQLANAHGANLDKEGILSGFTDKAVNVVAAHYGHLLHPSQNIDGSVLTEFFTHADKGLQLAGSFLQDTAPKLDYIRTRRETDSIYTLSAAKTFMDEFSGNPTVAVPLFGAYDNRAALQALGYNGKVEFVLAHEKYINPRGTDRVIFTRDTVTRSIIEDPVVRSMREARMPVVIYEDSLGKGDHTLGTRQNPGLIPQLQYALGPEIPIVGFRSVVSGKPWYPKEFAHAVTTIDGMIDGTARAYYIPDLLGGPDRRTTNKDTTRWRRTHRRWERSAA